MLLRPVAYGQTHKPPDLLAGERKREREGYSGVQDTHG